MISFEEYPNFMGAPLEPMRVIRPLVSASVDCQQNCAKLYNKWRDLFHDSAIAGGGVMVAFCARTSACADNEICTVESEIVGNVVEGIYVPSAIPLIDDAFAEEVVDRIFVMTGGFQGEKVVEELSATSASRLNTLSESITKFGINWNYPSDQVG